MIYLAKHEGRPGRGELALRLWREAQQSIHERYGPDSPNPKAYHNAVHTEDVVWATRSIVVELINHRTLQPADLDLGTVAAGYHDYFHGEGKEHGDDERASAEKAAEDMRATGEFSEEEIERVQLAIQATILQPAEGSGRIQAATEDPLTQALADADLSTLGEMQNIFWERALAFLHEDSGNSEPSDDEIKKFMSKEITFLESHQYYTKEARQFFPFKEMNIVWLQSQL